MATDEFVARLVTDAPRPARIASVESEHLAPTGEAGFAIVESNDQGRVRTFVSPDLATCADCLDELFDPSDRRARYPFINCTNCGPRFTITVSLPYDRPNTTMHAFALCDACASEYHDPADRRFHAQPVACARCGPRLWFEHGDDRFGAGLRCRPRRRAGGARPRRDRGGQGSRRVPPGLRRGIRLRCRAAAHTQAPLREAVRRHGARPRRGRRPGPPRPGGRGPPHVGRAADRPRATPGRGTGLCARRARESTARRAAAVHAPAPPPVRSGAGRRPRGACPDGAGDDERQPDRRAHLLRGRRRSATAGAHRRRLAPARPAHPRPLRRLRPRGRPGNRERTAVAPLPGLRTPPRPPPLRCRTHAWPSEAS